MATVLEPGVDDAAIDAALGKFGTNEGGDVVRRQQPNPKRPASKRLTVKRRSSQSADAAGVP